MCKNSECMKKWHSVCMPSSTFHLHHLVFGYTLLWPYEEEMAQTVDWLERVQRGSSIPNLPKDQFPQLLKLLIDYLCINKKNIWFVALKRQVYTNRQRKSSEVLATKRSQQGFSRWNIYDHLVIRHEEIKKNCYPKRKCKKLEIPPRKSVTVQDQDLKRL